MSASEAIQPTLDVPTYVGIFWDFENVRIPPGVKTSAAANKIREAVLEHGHVVERRLYYDSRKHTERNTDRVTLDLSGFTLVDCPTRNMKETLDKKLIVDLMQFAWQHIVGRTQCCVVLITSDGDYSYTLAKVRDLGVKTVVIFGARPTTADVLLDVCDYARSWLHDVLADPEDPDADDQALPSPAGTLPSPRSPDAALGPPGEGGGALAANIDIDIAEKSRSLDDALDGRHITLCYCLRELQNKAAHGISGRSSQTVDENAQWVLDINLAKAFRRKTGRIRMFERTLYGKHTPQDAQAVASQMEASAYRDVRDSAVHGGFVELGRQDLQLSTANSGAGVVYTPVDTTVLLAADRAALSPEVYVRLTREGRMQLEDPEEAARMIMRSYSEPPAPAPAPAPTEPEKLAKPPPAEAPLRPPPAPYLPPGTASAPPPTAPPNARPSPPPPPPLPPAQAQPKPPVSTQQGPAHNSNQIPKRETWKWKTELCTYYHRSGTCRSGDLCKFAHGYAELQRYRPIVICRNWNGAAGSCQNGDKCDFKHA